MPEKKVVLKIAVAASSLFFLLSCTSFYVGRYVLWNVPGITDYKIFPNRVIEKTSNPFHFITSQEAEDNFMRRFETIEYKYEDQTRTEALETMLDATGTTAFIVIQDDIILYENYFNGYQRDSINTSFSVAKSFASALIGIAIDEGYIESVDEPITNYIPELEGDGFKKITIRHLLLMSSGLKHEYGYFPWHDISKSYYFPNIRELVPNAVIIEEPGEHFNYNDLHTQMLGVILERITGMTVSEFLQEKIWKPLGMEFDGSWSLDSESSGFELMAAGLNARAIDFAKFGRLYLSKGRWDGKQVISENWVTESTRIHPPGGNEDYYTANNRDSRLAFFSNADGYYSYQWWGYDGKEENSNDFFAAGAFGQYIYVSPKSNTVIVRYGKEWGRVDWWPEILREIADKL